MTRLRFATRLNPSKTEAGELAGYGNVTFAPMDALADGLGGLDTSLERPADELADGSYSYFAEGDLLLAKVTPCFENGKKALVTKLPNRIGFATSEVHVIRSDRRKVDPNYLRYLLSSETFRAAGIASMTGAGGLRRISDNAIKDFQLPVATLAAQKAIATFLDRETARINKLIEKKEHQVRLLAERQSTIIEAATNHPNAKLSKLGYHVRILPGYAFPSEEFQADDNGVRLLRGVNITPGAVRWHDVVYWPLNKLEEVRDYLLRAGDIIFGMDRPWVSAGIRVVEITDADTPSLLLQRVCRITPSATLDKGYLKLILSSQQFLGYFEPIMTGVSVPHVSAEQISSFRFGLIPVHDQRRIAHGVQHELAGLRTTSSKIENSISLLREHRAALITAAVAGQVDIRENLPAVISTSDRDRFRLVVGAEIIHQHRSTPKFGRVKLQKELYLAEAHLGINELQGNYFRKAAGPLDRALIEETERAVEAAGYYRASQADGAGTTVTYAPLSNAGRHSAELKSLLGPRADALGGLIALLRDFGTEAVEAIATLYAVWNDALIDGRQPADSMIVNGVLTEWHEEKGKKFKDSDLRHWLDWMKRNGLTPRGQGPRTARTMTRDMFA